MVSELAGKASLVARARAIGIDLEQYPKRVAGILADIKQRENKWYSYEAADGSLAMLIWGHLGQVKPHFTLESFRVIVEDYEDTGAFSKDATS